MGGGRGGKWGYKDASGYIEDDIPEDPTRSLLPIATGETFFLNIFPIFFYVICIHTY